MANEIIMNEEVIETTEDIVTSGTGKWGKIAVGIGVAVGVGIMAYKGGKRLFAKIKAHKEQKAAMAQESETSANDIEASEEA